MYVYIYIYTYIYIYIYIYIRTKAKCTKEWKQSSAIQQLLEALLLAMKMWGNTKVSLVKPSQSTSRRVLSFKDSGLFSDR